MKTLFTLLFCVTISTSFGQNAIGIQSDLKGLAGTNLKVGLTTITAFSSPDIKGTRYLYEVWTPGSVTDEEQNTFSNGYTFNFDKINHELYAKHGGEGGISVLIEKPKIAKFTIGNKNFIAARYVKGSDAKTSGRFYHALVVDTANVSLYKLGVTKFHKANTRDLYAVKTGNFSSEYIDNNTYFVSIKNSDIKKVVLTETGIYKALKEFDTRTEQFSKNYPAREIDESYLVDLVKYLNQE